MMEKGHYPAGGELGPLHRWRAVGQYAEMKLASKFLQHGQSVWIGLTSTQPMFPVDLCRFLLYSRVRQTPTAQGLIPYRRQHGCRGREMTQVLVVITPSNIRDLAIGSGKFKTAQLWPAATHSVTGFGQCIAN